MAFGEDLAMFINPMTPGYAVATIGAVDVAGIFDSQYGDTLGLVSGYTPAFICASADVSAVAEGQTITVGAINFTVAGVEHDSALRTGFCVLRLETA